MNNKPEIAVYYFPNYHQDRRNKLAHGEGWNEWVLMKEAKPRFKGHQQPKVPLWGYEDESDPTVMRRKINAASESGIDAFIFDWYFYEDGLFLERALEEGFMPVEKGSKLKFALMWANHDWVDIHPRTNGVKPELLYPGRLSDAAYERMCDYVIEKYFHHPAYWKLDGCPYFSVYDLHRFGDLSRLELFRQKTRAAGFPDLHLNMVYWGKPILPGEGGPVPFDAIIRQRHFDSITSYVWVHHSRLDQFPVSSYSKARDEYFAFYRELNARCPIPFYPNVTMGWDNSPRTNQNTPFTPEYGATMYGSPDEFRQALDIAGKFTPRIITINAWNEWTEGSYLEPDMINGTGYLDAIRQFKDSESLALV